MYENKNLKFVSNSTLMIGRLLQLLSLFYAIVCFCPQPLSHFFPFFVCSFKYVKLIALVATFFVQTTKIVRFQRWFRYIFFLRHIFHCFSILNYW